MGCLGVLLGVQEWEMGSLWVQGWEMGVSMGAFGGAGVGDGSLQVLLWN